MYKFFKILSNELNSSFMSNIGPINGAQHQKTGKDFVNELFNADEEEEEELTNREIENNIEQSISIKDDLSNQTMSFRNENSIKQDNQAAPKVVHFPEETSQFRIDNHDIILNLSKYTLRKIVMLICDEAVCF